MAVAEVTAAGAERALDALAMERARRDPLARRALRSATPKLCAAAVLLGVWQVVVSLRLQSTRVIPAPVDVGRSLVDLGRQGEITRAATTSLRRGVVGFTIALLIGTPLGLLVARVRPVRLGIGSLVAGLQSLPSVTWVPVGIVWFGISETTVVFVVVMGAFPSIAQGIVAAIDQMPPLLVRVGRSMGARGPALYRHVIIPAALPGYIAGMKQAWAFSWRSLMGAELIARSHDLGLGLGQLLDNARQLSDTALMMSSVFLILAVGIAVDTFVFAPLDRAVRTRRGLATS